MGTDERSQRIIELKLGLDHQFFKGFLATYRLPEGLNNTHMIAIMKLQFSRSMPICTLSRQLNLEKGSFTPIVARLSRLGYIDKRQSRLDKRVYELSLTEKGEEAAAAFSQAHVRYIKERLALLPEGKREQFFQAVEFLDTCLSSFPEEPVSP